MNPSLELTTIWLVLAACALGAALFGLYRASMRRTRAETRLAEVQKALAEAASRREAAEGGQSELRGALQSAESRIARADQQVVDMRGQMADWAKTKDEYVKAAKAGALESARELSNKLLEDHKREAGAAKKENEESTKKLRNEFEKIVGSVASLSDQVTDSRKTMDNVHRALSNPGEAGQFAEIGLENQLKNFGLEPGLDFSMQHTVTGEDGEGTLRPDAVVFLPGESAMVIDSKASKFLLELSQADSDDAEEAAYQSLANTMREHLKGLASKNYQNAVAASYRSSGHGGKLNHVISVMYLPSDGTLEHMLRVDPDFKRRAQKNDIIVVGPSGLTALIAVARLNINSGRQAENQARIVDGTRSFIESVATALEHMERVGKGIKSAADNFGRMSGSVNTRVLPRARNLIGLGVNPAHNKSLPDNLPSFHVNQVEDMGTIDGEAEEVAPVERLDDRRKQGEG